MTNSEAKLVIRALALAWQMRRPVTREDIKQVYEAIDIADKALSKEADDD
jgi:hypothetical protein